MPTKHAKHAKGERMAVIAWRRGSYHSALVGHQNAKTMALENGLCFGPDVRGTIKMRHDGQEPPNGAMPVEWLSSKKWQTTMEVEFIGEAALRVLKAIKLPRGVTIVFSEEGAA